MARPISKVAPQWWDYTTLDAELLEDAAKLNEKSLLKLSRPGFTVHYYETLEDFYLAEALEYVEAWRKATPDNPAGICGPIGPTEQLPLVARIVNAIGLKLHDAHFWGMDEWVENGKPVSIDHPLSFAKADMEMCFNKIDKKLVMPRENIHFPTGDLAAYSRSYDTVHCVVMQGGQGEVKHWAFNDPPKRAGKWKNAPPPPSEYRKLKTRIVDLHPMTVIQNARTSGGGYVAAVPMQACSVGPVETWKSDRVSIWHAGMHDNPFGMRLTAWMISKKLPDSSVPMSLLAEHDNVHFHYYRPAIGTVAAEMHWMRGEYFDLQVNGYGGVDYNSDELSAEALHRSCETLRRDGAGAILATIITEKIDLMIARLKRLVDLRERDPLAKQIIAGIHIEGPFISEVAGYRGAHPADAVMPASVEVAKQLHDACGGLLRVLTLAPETDANTATTSWLAKNRVTVSAGHTDASLAQLKAACDAGLSMFTHVGNGCPMHGMHRHDNIIQRALHLRDKLWLCFIADTVHVPAVALANYLALAGDRAVVVTDAIAPAGLGPGRYKLGRWDLLIGVDMVARAPDGSHFVGAAITMGQSHANLREKLGLSEARCRQLLVENPQRAIGAAV